MSTLGVPISPLSLDTLTRDLWGGYDQTVIAGLAELADEKCYQPKFYKAPASIDELIAPGAYVAYGLPITPGSLIYGVYLPASPTTGLPAPFILQITDTSLEHEFFDEPIPSYFLANFKPTYLSAVAALAGSFPNLLNCVYPVVGSGLFKVELWSTAAVVQRVELVFGVLEVCE